MADKITAAHELRSEVDRIRKQGLSGKYFDLHRPVDLNSHLDYHIGYETSGTYEPANLDGIDLSGFRLTGDFRGATFRNANLSGSFWDSAKIGVINVRENSPGEHLRELVLLAPWFPAGIFKDEEEDDVRAEEAFWGKKKEFVTLLTGATLDGAEFRKCDFHGVNAQRCSAIDAQFVRCQLMGADMCHSRLEGCEFIGSDVNGLKLKGASRRVGDQPLDAESSVELLLNFVSIEAVAALSSLLLQAQKIPQETAKWIALAVAAVYVLLTFGLDRCRPPTVRRNFRKLSIPIMCLLAVEATLAMFQLIFDPNVQLEPFKYVIAVWVASAASLIFVRRVRYGSFRPIQLLAPGEDLLSLFLFAASYTFLYMVKSNSDYSKAITMLAIGILATSAVLVFGTIRRLGAEE